MKILRRILCILLLPCLLCGAVSCNRETPPPKRGIFITEEKTPEMSDEAQTAVRDAVEHILGALSPAARDLFTRRLPDLSDRMLCSVAATGAEEGAICSFFSRVDAASSLCAAALGGERTLSDAEREDLARLCLDGAGALGRGFFRSLLYDAVLWRFDYRVEDYRIKAEMYRDMKGYQSLFAHYVSLSEEQGGKRAEFMKIGREDFASALAFFYLGYLFFTSDADVLSLSDLALTDEEVRSLIVNAEISPDLSDAEWATVFSVLEDFGTVGDVLAAARSAGDIPKVTSFVTSLCSLARTAQSSFTREDVAALRTAEEGSYVRAVYACLDADTAARLDAVFRDFSLTGAAYRDILSRPAVRDFLGDDSALPSALSDAADADVSDILRSVLRGVFYD